MKETTSLEEALLFNGNKRKDVMRKMLWLGLCFSILLCCCRKDNELHLDLGYAYAPNDVHRYVIYDVDSTIYDAFNKDTVRYKYQLKEFVESIFPDNEGRPSMRIERYFRNYNPSQPYDSLPWILKNVWYATRTSRDFERVEDNIRYVKLIFPANDQDSWNGNAQNTIGDWEYQYNGLNQKVDMGVFHFDSTARILEKVDTNLLYYKMYTDVYAKNVGLVSRQIIDVADVNIVVGVSVLHRIKSGLIYNATVHSYGKQ
jgi:hypothetical protein